MNKKLIPGIFFALVCLSLLAPLWVFKDLLFPYVTSKAFYFRLIIELTLPFYAYLLVSRPDLRPNFKKNPLNLVMVVFLLLNIISAFAGVSVIRSLWGNFERMGGAFYVGTLTMLYFYVVMIGQMGDEDIKSTLSYAWLALFGALAGIAIWVAASLDFASGLFLTLGIIIYYLLICWFEGNFIKRLLQAFLLGALVVTVNGIFGKLGLPILVQDPSLPGRVSSTLGNPIYVGSFLIIPLFISLFFGLQAEKKLEKYSFYLFGFLFLVGIFLSGTRGAFVGLVGGVFLSSLIFLAVLPKSKLKFYGWMAVAAFGIIFAVLFTFNSRLPQGSVLRRLFTLEDSNTQARIIQWGVALKGFKDHPLFGVGPENYYVIGNKYYNPAIFAFDRSWFDKPHNYPLEILVTDGAVGFAAYLGLLVFIVWAFYRGYKKGYLTSLELSVLVGALLVYQIQNLTVFDTIPASLTFYCYAGFAGFLWYVSGDGDKKDKAQNKKTAAASMQPLPVTVLGVSLVVVAYLVYSTVVVPMQISSNVNYGYAYMGVDAQKGFNYFQAAAAAPFNFDKTETAQKYAEAATNNARGATAATQDLSNKILDGSISSLNDAIIIEPTYPILWIELSQAYLFKGVQNGKLVSFNPQAETAIDRAVALAPLREEAYLTKSQVLSIKGDMAGAEKIILDLQKEFPLDTSLNSQLAALYRSDGKVDLAVKLMEQAQSNGYIFTSVNDMGWLISYYQNAKQYAKALALAEKGAVLEPNNLDLLSDTAQLYVLTGQNQKAIDLAKAIIQADPTRQKALQPLITAASQGQK